MRRSLSFDYTCLQCGKTMPPNHETMVCECGGFYHADAPGISGSSDGYDAGYDHTLGCYVSSWKDAEKKAKAFRSEQHPEGFIIAQGNKDFIKRCRDTVKNREEIIKETYAKEGINYKKGSNCHWDDQKGCFVKQGTKEPIGRRVKVKKVSTRISEKVKAAAIVLMLLSNIAYANHLKEIGVPFVEIEVRGEKYEVPIHNYEFTHEKAQIWLKALDGDKYARKVLLAGKDEKVLFIGDGESIRWLHLTESDAWVTTT
jgi:hypothetical protein